MININYLRSGTINTLNNCIINNKEKDRLLQYLRLSQGFSNAHDYAICKNYLKKI